MIPRSGVHVVCLAAAAVVLSAAEPTSEMQVLEQTGRVGRFSVGERIAQYGPSVKRTEANRYVADGTLWFVTDNNGVIQNIEVRTQGAFTQRLVTIEESTMREVLQRYGKVDELTRESGRINLKYPGFTFSFNGTSNRQSGPVANTEDSLNARIRSITLHYNLRAG